VPAPLPVCACVPVCVFACVRVLVRVCAYAFVCMCLSVCAYAFVCMCLSVCACACVGMCLFACARAGTCLCVCLCVCACACVCLCVCTRVPVCMPHYLDMLCVGWWKGFTLALCKWKDALIWSIPSRARICWSFSQYADPIHHVGAVGY